MSSFDQMDLNRVQRDIIFKGPISSKIKAARKEAIKKNLFKYIGDYYGIDGHDQLISRKFKYNDYKKIEYKFINCQELLRQRIYE